MYRRKIIISIILGVKKKAYELAFFILFNFNQEYTAFDSTFELLFFCLAIFLHRNLK